jgi:hypothetical protein
VRVEPQPDQPARREAKNEHLPFAAPKTATYAADRAADSDQKPLNEQYWGWGFAEWRTEDSLIKCHGLEAAALRRRPAFLAFVLSP